MKERLTRNLSLKILSIILAFFAWMTVVNISNPEVTGVKEVTLEVSNEEVMSKANLAYDIESKKSTVTIAYKVHMKDRASISSKDFRAYIDLEDYYPVTGTVPVYVEILNNKEMLSSVEAKPAVMHVTTENLQRKDFDLQYVLTGEAEDGYEIDQVTLSPKTVSVEGPQSAIGKISSVGIEVDVDGINTEKTGTAVPLFYDANGNDPEVGDKVTINHQEVDYRIQVMKVKTMNLNFEVGGQVAKGYRYVGFEASAESVSVLGLKSVISDIDTITIPASVLNMEGAREDKQITVNVEDYLPDPENMSIPWNSQVTVILKVRQLVTKTVRIPASRIIKEGALEKNDYQYSQNYLDVVVEGLQENLATLEASDIVVEMDVSAMANEGTYDAGLVFDGLRDDFEVVSYSGLQVEVVQREPVGQPVSSEGPTTGPHAPSTSSPETEKESSSEAQGTQPSKSTEAPTATEAHSGAEGSSETQKPEEQA